MKFIKDLGIQFATVNSTQKKRFGLYECGECGNHIRARVDNINNGNTKRCSYCSTKDGITAVVHGMSRTKLYHVWNGMKKRCRNKNLPNYKDYGGRGIYVCDQWKEYMPFFTWANSNGYKDGLWIDRIDNDGIYEPNNCRWATPTVQQRNTRRIARNNTSGYRGVCFNKSEGRYVSRIGIDSKQIYLGSFDSAKDGGIAYDNYIDKYNLEHTKNFPTKDTK